MLPLALLHYKFANGVLSKIIIIYNLRFRVKSMFLKQKCQPLRRAAVSVVFAMATLGSTTQIGLFQLAKECSELLTFLGTNFENGV